MHDGATGGLEGSSQALYGPTLHQTTLSSKFSDVEDYRQDWKAVDAFNALWMSCASLGTKPTRPRINLRLQRLLIRLPSITTETPHASLSFLLCSESERWTLTSERHP